MPDAKLRMLHVEQGWTLQPEDEASKPYLEHLQQNGFAKHFMSGEQIEYAELEVEEAAKILGLTVMTYGKKSKVNRVFHLTGALPTSEPSTFATPQTIELRFKRHVWPEEEEEWYKAGQTPAQDAAEAALRGQGEVTIKSVPLWRPTRGEFVFTQGRLTGWVAELWDDHDSLAGQLGIAMSPRLFAAVPFLRTHNKPGVELRFDTECGSIEDAREHIRKYLEQLDKLVISAWADVKNKMGV